MVLSPEESDSTTVKDTFPCTDYVDEDLNELNIKKSALALFISVIDNDLVFQEFKEYFDSKTLNNLLNVTKQFYGIKKRNFYWNLNKMYSERYYCDVAFRRKIDSIITNANIQLSVNLTEPKDVKVVDLNMLKNLNSLNIYRCHNIVDVIPLRNIHTLSLNQCYGVSDISPLSNIHTLSLINCRDISDISALCSVHTLTLERCNNITDVSALGNVTYINMYL
jgi:hypothetical protein